MSTNDNIQEIIIRYLNEESSVEENEKLQQWRNEDPAHETEFNIMNRLWKDSAVGALRRFDTQKAWLKVSAGISSAKKGKVVPMFPWRRAIGAAASVLLIAGTIYFYYHAPKTEWQEVLAQKSNKNLQLSDGSIITLRKGSKLRLPDNYGFDSRQVQLTGEAYFQIVHNIQSPFYLNTPKSSIQDLGTAFLVVSNDSVEQVMVTEGKVSFSGKEEGGKALMVEAGEGAELKGRKPELKFRHNGNMLAWKTKMLVFDNTPLTQVAEDLKDYFSLNVQLSPDLQANPILITAQFRDEPLDKVIEELHLLSGLSFRMQGSSLYVSK
jgi:transmembrane sensor